MKASKLIILIFLGLFGIVLILGAIGPKKVSVERSITIDQPISTVFKYTTDFDHTLAWNPWMDQDPQAKHTFTGEPGKKEVAGPGMVKKSVKATWKFKK